jgi:hypothetical protein
LWRGTALHLRASAWRHSLLIAHCSAFVGWLLLLLLLSVCHSLLWLFAQAMLTA